MISICASTKDQIRKIIRDAFMAAQAAGELSPGTPPDFTVDVPADTSKGDFATNAAMTGARVFRMAPQKLAVALTARMNFTGTKIDRCEIAGPGFINFFMTPGWYASQVEEVLA